MPEVKNTFIKGKMNKDLDPRILPEGEYFDAKNIKVSRSEGGDVGVVENILSNNKVSGIESDLSSTEVIGHVVDFENKNVYYFVTNFSNADSNIKAPSSAKCAIVKYSPDSSPTTTTIFKTYRFNFNKSFAIHGVNILDGFLYFTDNLNQPRVFNVEKSNLYTDDQYFEDKISVAKYAPYCAPKFLKPKYILTVNGAVTDNATVIISAANSSLAADHAAGKKFLVRHDSLDDDVIINNISSTTLTLSENVTIADGQKLSIIGSSMIDNSAADSGIDKEFLKEKFARFSYRYRFEDNTYSIFAPFTQIAFVPEIQTFDNTEKENAYKETEVSTFVNSINYLELEIMLPTLDPYSDLLIKEIEILFKESDSLAVKVLDTIDLTNISTLRKDPSTITNGVVSGSKIKKYINNTVSGSTNDRRKELYYIYRSEEPYKLLPESQTFRVYDRVPVKALAQEITGNRLVYGNFVTGKELPPSGLNFELSTGSKNEEDEFLYEEYKRHTLKQDRTYVVGVVFSDRYGRQSPVILSNQHSSSIQHKRSQISLNGDSLKVIFNEGVDSSFLWQADTNPLGWYSYRIVVKQTEQDYYNVYTPGVVWYDTGGTGDNMSYFPIYGDNINKIPRDEVTEGSNINLSTSSVILDGILENGDTGIQTSTHNIISIGKLDDFGIEDADKVEFYDKDKQYLFAQIKGGYGQQTQGGASSNVPSLAVFETKPFKSKLDIFYETSTCGLISDLNSKINSGGGSSSASSLVLRNLNDDADLDEFAEDTAGNSYIMIIKVFDANGTQLTPGTNNLSISVQTVIRVEDNINNSYFNDFSAEQIGNTDVIKLKLINGQEFRPSPSNKYTITFRATTSNGAQNFTKEIFVTNAAPVLAFIPNADRIGYAADETGVIATVNSSGEISGKNGSSNSTRWTNRLTYDKVSGYSNVSVSSQGAISLATAIGASASNLSFVLRATDVAGLTDTLTVPLSLEFGDIINVTEKTGTGFNYYARCYGQGGQGDGYDPGDKYEEYFIPSNYGYYEVDGTCGGDYEDVLSNHNAYDETTNSPVPATHKFATVSVDGTVILDVSNYTWNDSTEAFWIRPAPHQNTDPTDSGYVGASDSNFIVTVTSYITGSAVTTDYELVVGYEQIGAVMEPVHRVLIKRNNITTTQYS